MTAAGNHYDMLSSEDVLLLLHRDNYTKTWDVLSFISFHCPNSVACVCFGLNHELCKNGWIDRVSVWTIDLCGPKEQYVRWGLYAPQVGTCCPITLDTKMPKKIDDAYVFTACENAGNRNSGADRHGDVDSTSDGCEWQFSGVCTELSTSCVREPSSGSHRCRDHRWGSRHSFQRSSVWVLASMWRRMPVSGKSFMCRLQFQVRSWYASAASG